MSTYASILAEYNNLFFFIFKKNLFISTIYITKNKTINNMLPRTSGQDGDVGRHTVLLEQPKEGQQQI